MIGIAITVRSRVFADFLVETLIPKIREGEREECLLPHSVLALHVPALRSRELPNPKQPPGPPSSSPRNQKHIRRQCTPSACASGTSKSPQNLSSSAPLQHNSILSSLLRLCGFQIERSTNHEILPRIEIPRALTSSASGPPRHVHDVTSCHHLPRFLPAAPQRRETTRSGNTEITTAPGRVVSPAGKKKPEAWKL